VSDPTPEERTTLIMVARNDAQRRSTAEREIRAAAREAEVRALREAADIALRWSIDAPRKPGVYEALRMLSRHLRAEADRRARDA